MNEVNKLNNINKINYFCKLFQYKDILSTKTFSNKIKSYRNQIKINYQKEPLFFEIMPTINKQATSNNIYQSFIKNSIKYNSQLVRLIHRTIKNKYEKKPYFEIKNVDNFFLYKFPKIDALKMRMEKLNNKKNKKIKIIRLNKDKIKRYKTCMEKSIEMNYFNKSEIIDDIDFKKIKNISKCDSTKNSDNNMNNKYNFSFNLDYGISKRRNTKLNSYIYKSNYNFNDSKKNNNSSIISLSSQSISKEKSLDIINKCNKEIEQGSKFNISLHKYIKDFHKSFQLNISKDDLLDVEHKVLLEKKKLKNKFVKFEEKNIKKIKKFMKNKISNNLAFKNRKEYNEILKIEKDANAYNFQLLEINKEKKIIKKKLAQNKNTIDKVIKMAEGEFNNNILLRERIKKISEKYRKIKRKTRSNISQLVRNDNSIFFKDKSF